MSFPTELWTDTAVTKACGHGRGTPGQGSASHMPTLSLLPVPHPTTFREPSTSPEEAGSRIWVTPPPDLTVLLHVQPEPSPQAGEASRANAHFRPGSGLGSWGDGVWLPGPHARPVCSRTGSGPPVLATQHLLHRALPTCTWRLGASRSRRLASRIFFLPPFPLKSPTLPSSRSHSPSSPACGACAPAAASSSCSSEA